MRDSGPSGLADPPRPFVFRASHLDGRTVLPFEEFHFDLHLFQVDGPELGYFVHAFAQLVHAGLGPRRGKARLRSIACLDENHSPLRTIDFDSRGLRVDDNFPTLSISLEPYPTNVDRLQVRFVTPTELKGGGRSREEPDFGLLFSRARDRVSTLRALYGCGPLDLDFQRLGELARQVRLIRSVLTRVDAERHSSRTGQTHALSGFVGEAEYAGDLSALAPFLRAAEWTGVGRQTVWGKGEMRCRIVPSD
jgi:hypothetical protein